MFHILLAEDDANLRNVVEKSLRNAGFTVVAAVDGRTAYDQFCSERFDLVITDVMMPFMDGNPVKWRIMALAFVTRIKSIFSHLSIQAAGSKI